MTSSPVVRVVPLQPHCFAFGGFELQMMGAMEAARSVGANVSHLDFWSKDASFDVLHLWGLSAQHSQTAHWAHLAGKKVLVSALVNYPGWKQRLRLIASWLLGPARVRKQMLSWVDGVTVVNEQQKNYLAYSIGYPADKIFVIPNIVDEIFFTKDEGNSNFDVGLEDYVICTGNICARKNQLSLARACKQIGVPLLIVGDVLLGEESYGKALVDEISGCPDIRWIKGLAPASEELASAYKRAAVFALPSYSEQQPISALEAAAARKPLLLADRAYAKQEFYANAALVNPDSVSSIAETLRKVLDTPERYIPPEKSIEKCRFRMVGESYATVYAQLTVAARTVTGKQQLVGDRKNSISKTFRYGLSSGQVKKLIRNRVGRMIARKPWMFFPVFSRIDEYRELLVQPDTDIVFEGFPRSGNTFAVVAFESVQKGNIKIAHHLHAQAQVFRAVEMGLPVCLLIRQPVDAMKSLMVREPDLLSSTILKGYLEFYSDLFCVKDKLLIATFDEITADFGKVIERINQRFEKQYNRFEHTPESIEAIFRKIKEINDRVDAGSFMTIAIPNKNKNVLKSRLVLNDRDLLLLEQATEIYRVYCESRG